MNRCIYTGILLAVCTVVLSGQSPWIRSKAGFYAQFSYQTIPAYTTLFGTSNTDILLRRKVSENAVQLYGEYGITRKTTVSLALPLRWSRRGAIIPGPVSTPPGPEGKILGLGNVSVGIRRQLIQKKITLSGTLKLDLPARKNEQETLLSVGYQAFTAMPMLNIGQGFRHGYWFAYGGYGLRTNNYSHFFNTGVEGGVHFGRIWLIGFSEYVQSLNNGNRIPPVSDLSTGLYVDRQGWLSVGTKGIYELSRFVGVVVSAAGAVDAVYVPKSPSLALSVYFKWD